MISTKLVLKLSRLAAMTLVLGTLAAPFATNASTSQPRDTNDNSIIWGGAYSKTEWLNDVTKGDNNGAVHHSAANLQQIYYKEGRGITQANFMSGSTVDGVVFKDGHVEVNGKTVATGAQSIGRNYMDGSHKSGSVWERSTSVSFRANSIQAFVDMEGGTFHYAVLKSCGNAVRATPTSTPKPSVTPTPSPSPTPKPTPSPSASPSPSPAVFKCLSLTATQPDKAKQPGMFRFTVESSVDKSLAITGYRFTVTEKDNDDSTTNADVRDVTTNSTDITFGAGTWKVDAQVKTSAGITAVNDACSATVMVTQQSPSPSPSTTPSTTPKPSATPTPTGQVLGASLPDTGPEVLLGGAAGVTAVGYASRAYLRSRKSVIEAMRGKTRIK